MDFQIATLVVFNRQWMTDRTVNMLINVDVHACTRGLDVSEPTSGGNMYTKRFATSDCPVCRSAGTKASTCGLPSVEWTEQGSSYCPSLKSIG